ncbi:MAG: hypothetical protein SFW62_07180 [Alphaproteobacteria bacterium]|nr:hypothetical protein [Alphaproteobacteria bacterium]
MKFVSFSSLILAALILSGCNGTVIGLGGAALGIWGTKPGEEPPADTESQIAQHESWCYSTMGYSECYPHPQDVNPNRLINVDPANRYPLTPLAYREAMVESSR